MDGEIRRLHSSLLERVSDEEEAEREKIMFYGWRWSIDQLEGMFVMDLSM